MEESAKTAVRPSCRRQGSVVRQLVSERQRRRERVPVVNRRTVDPVELKIELSWSHRISPGRCRAQGHPRCGRGQQNRQRKSTNSIRLLPGRSMCQDENARHERKPQPVEMFHRVHVSVTSQSRLVGCKLQLCSGGKPGSKSGSLRHLSGCGEHALGVDRWRPDCLLDRLPDAVVK